MRYISGDPSGLSRRWLGGSLLAIMALCIVVGNTANVRAATMTSNQGSEVQATLCSEADAPDMTVHDPKDGTVYTSNPLVFKAGVADLSMASVFVDGSKIADMTLGGSAASFDVPLNLPGGLHTIKIAGYDLCGRESVVTNLSVTYKPPAATQPAKSTESIITASSSGGGSTPLAPVGATIGGSVVVNHDAAPSPDKSDEPAGANPGATDGGDTATGPGSPLLDRIGGWLNTGPTFQSITNFGRAAAGTVGVVLLLNAHVATMVGKEMLQAYLSQYHGTKLQKQRFFRRHLGQFRMAAQGAGVIMLVGMFVV